MTEDQPEDLPENLPEDSIEEMVAAALEELLLAEGFIPEWFRRVYENL